MKYTEFLDEIHRTRSVNTYESYRDALRLFPEGTKEEILAYIESPDVADSTKKLRLGILRQALLYDGALTKEIQRLISGFKPNVKVQPCPTSADIELLWNNLRTHRDKLVVALMAYNGLRVGEVAGITMADIGKNTVTLRNTKGKRDAVIPLVHPRVIEELAAYIAERPDSPALFVSKRGEPMSTITIKQMVGNEFKANGLDFHAHSLRRFFANTLMRNGVPLEMLCTCMRHSSVATTMRYLNINTDDVKQALEAAV